MNASERVGAAVGAVDVGAVDRAIPQGSSGRRGGASRPPVRRAELLPARRASGVPAVPDPTVRAGELARTLARHIRTRPLASLAVAVGVGFAVGGALSFRAGRIALAVAARHVARELLKRVL